MAKLTVKGVEFVRDTFYGIDRIKGAIGVIERLQAVIPSDTLVGVIPFETITIEVGDE